MRYRTALGEATEPTALLAALHGAQRAEVRRGQTLVGPHRDDLAIEIDGVDARAFASRGQQRLVALVLRLAEVLPVAEAAGTAPVLLLDDALSELDPGVRELVLRELGAAEQVFLTSPEPLGFQADRELKGVKALESLDLIPVERHGEGPARSVAGRDAGRRLESRRCGQKRCSGRRRCPTPASCCRVLPCWSTPRPGCRRRWS